MDYLQDLNPSQRQAVEATHGPVIVLAGAGSGKTKTLISRIAHLIRQGADPSSILAVTFTNKAAGEMKHRVALALGGGESPFSGRFAQPWMGFSAYAPEVSTFHSFCVKLLRAEAALLGYTRPFVIYDDADQLSLLKKIVEELNINSKVSSPKRFQHSINEAKCQATGPGELRPPEFSGSFGEQLLLVYKRYEECLKENQALDFGDLIVHAYRLLRDRPDVLKRYQDRFRFIMVDEYQDTNRAQYLLVSLLAAREKNLCVVGDEDQSIYRWRGADIRNILDFQKDYPNAKVVKLEQNYRSTQTIINAAAAVIRHNKSRYDKTLWTANDVGAKIRWATLANEREEAEFVSKEIQAYMRHSGIQYPDVAVFYRSHAQSRALEEAFRKIKVPYKIVGGVGFYERKEIKDVLAYLRVLVNPDDSVSLLRIINVPARGIGNASIEKVEEVARVRKCSLYSAIRIVLNEEVGALGPAARKKLFDFFRLMEGLVDLAKRELVSEIYHHLLDGTGYVQELKAEEGEEAAARVENLEEFGTVIQNFEEEAQRLGLTPEQGMLTNFLAQVTLESSLLEQQQASEQGQVSFMTLHSSKGLEFPLVFLVGCEEGIFPSRQALDDTDQTAIEEERRLAYVGLTRAKKFLLVTNALIRRIYGQEQFAAPSPFLMEIPAEFIQREERQGFAQASANWWAKSQATRRDATERTGGSKPRYGSSGYRYDYSESQDEAPKYQVKAAATASGGMLHVGQRVKHADYGVGTIKLLEGTEQDRKVTIEFSGRQTKKFLLKFVELEFPN